MNVVLEPLVLTRLTVNRAGILLGASGMHEMFETIAVGPFSPIAKYTESLFIGSLHDKTSVADTDVSDVDEGYTAPGNRSHGLHHQIQANQFSDPAFVYDVDLAHRQDDDAEIILQLASVLRDAPC